MAEASCRSRAPHLPLEERRAVLIAATRDALLEHGCIPTTKQIADTAGVAEGTIFRAFASKDELIDAVIADSFEPGPLADEIERIDATLPLRERLYALADIIHVRFQRIFALMEALGTVVPPNPGPEDGAAAESARVLAARLRAVIGPDGGELTVSVDEALHLLRLLTFSGSHPKISEGKPLPAHRIVDVLLDGISAHSAERNLA